MTAKGVRPHFKTRWGCLQCKQRKIKCDELKPSCANCSRHQASCSYLQFVPVVPRRSGNRRRSFISPSSAKNSPLRDPQTTELLVSQSSIPTALNPLPLRFTTLDLELFHFYLTKTCNDLLGYNITGTHIWQTSVIALALKYPFLLQEILSLAGIHLAFVHESSPSLSQKYREASNLYHGRSITRLRNEMQNLNRENGDACSICAALVSFQALATREQRGANLFFQDQRANENGPGVGIEWYKLHRGAKAVLQSALPCREGLLGDMIEHWEAMAPWDTIPLEPPEERNLDALATSWSFSDMLDEDKAILEETLQRLRLVFSLVSMMKFHLSTKIGKFRAILAWTVLIPDRFCEMVDERIPQALVIIGAYCVLLKRLDEFWWMRGKAEELLEAVQGELPDRSWDTWLAWPADEIHG